MSDAISEGYVLSRGECPRCGYTLRHHPDVGTYCGNGCWEESRTTATAGATCECFVPGKVTNPLNGSHSHWRARAGWAKTWRQNAALVAKCAINNNGLTLAPHMPKTITFTAHVVRKFDTDNLPACLKPVRDGLIDAGVIDDDGPDSGHTFRYEQVIDRARRGVTIAVTEEDV